ncbi:MAG: peptidoglycan bridge formation glycyltransferase FemA/FemB family protein [Chloroflexi bacterium]|nr:peptidoglycan bridge formation glycyltransferase FemA/FemB family protein [Chloroflexota bacterium]
MTSDNTVCHLTEDPQRWDAFVEKSPHGSLLQSYAWGEFKGGYGWEPQRIGLESNGELVAGAQILYHATPLGSIAYVPKGPVLDPEEPGLLDALLDAVHQHARRRGAVFLKLEPHVPIGEALLTRRFRPSPPVQAKCTVVVDLSPDLQTVSARQKSKTRYNVGLAARRGVTVRQARIDELPVFSDLMQVTGERDVFHIRPLSYFQKLMETLGDKTALFLAAHEGEVLAGILVSAFGEEGIYLYGASSNAHRNLMPTYLLQWEAMKWAKAQGCRRYDLWGIPEVPEGEGARSAEREAGDGGQGSGARETASGNASLEGAWGLFRFKTGFGGEIVHCPGAFDYVYSRARYWLWTQVVPRVLGARRRMAD